MKEKGFTLIELALALAVGTVILSGAVLAVYQILVSTNRANNQVTSLNDLNRAALSLKNDLLMTQTANLSGGSAILQWYDYTSSFGSTFQTSYSANYTLLPNKQLWRTFGTATNPVTSLIARNVTSLTFFPSGVVSSSNVTVAISSSNTTPPSGRQTLNFSVHMRPQIIQ